jgi:hypothetical protein
MCIFSKYKDIFGKSNESVHSIRLLDFAFIDVIMTFIGAYYISKYYNNNIWTMFTLLFIYGEILHLLFCVETKFISLFCKDCLN